MSKVICDVCGTTFPETANQCPICGSAKNASAQTGAESGVQAETGAGHSHVSGGRFSKSNVRKRNKTGQPMQRSSREAAKKDNENEGSNKGLVIIVIVLLLAIIAVFAYLAITWFGPDKDSDEQEKNPSVQTTTQDQTPEDEETEPQSRPSGVACTDITGFPTVLEFPNTERSQLISVSLNPSNTTDKVVFTSLDTTVATVTEGGLVTPVGPGETKIIIVCGDIRKECVVYCNFGNSGTDTDPTTPTEPDPGPGPSTDAFEMTLNTKYITSEGVGDVTLAAGKTWRMYATISVEASKVVWTSDDEAYVTIKDGVVTAVASTESLKAKYVLVHAEYGGVKYSCRIRVNAADSSGSQTTTPPATEPTPPAVDPANFTMEFNTKYVTAEGYGDVKLHVGNSWKMYKTISVPADQVTWVSENPAVATVENGVVTAVSTGNSNIGVVMIHAEYAGVRYTCIVRVEN